MISRVDFVGALDYLLKTEAWEKKLDIVFREMNNDFVDGAAFFDTTLISIIIDLLDKGMHEECDYVDWWFNSCIIDREYGCTIAVLDGKQYNIQTPDDLYDFIVKRYSLE